MKKNNKNVNEPYQISIRFYNIKDIEKVKRFCKNNKINNLGKALKDKNIINNLFSKIILNYIDQKEVEQSEKIISDIVSPIIKKTIRNAINDLASLIVSNYEKHDLNINNIIDIGTYIANLISFKENEKKFGIKSDPLFKRPMWLLNNK